MPFRNLDEKTRELMLEEIDEDQKNGTLYLGKRLNSAGRSAFPTLLREAAATHDVRWLAASLQGKFNTLESRGGKPCKVPNNASEVLAEGEFNRFYIRALCRRALDESRELRVYRAKQVAEPRPGSTAKIGTRPDPKRLLEDLRSNKGTDTALGLPNGPNSGLSVELL